MKLNTQTFIERARQVHGNRYDYSKVEYKRSTEKVKIFCPLHGAFLQAPENHVNQKQHCPKCANLRKGKHERYSFQWMQQRPERAYAPALLYVVDAGAYIELGIKTTSVMPMKHKLLHLLYLSLKDAYLLQDKIEKALESHRHETYDIYAEKSKRWNNKKHVLETLQEILPKPEYPYK